MVLFTAATNQSMVAAAPERRLTGYVMTDSNIYTARDAWLANAAAAEATYGHISTWDTSGVSDMTGLFCGDDCSLTYPGLTECTPVVLCNEAARSFNANIGAWDTSSVTSMRAMFKSAFDFDKPIGDWDVSNVKDMDSMFQHAFDFNCPIGDWSVDRVTDMSSMFFQAEKFNQPLCDWDIGYYTEISEMFSWTYAFDQYLNWCVINYLYAPFGEPGNSAVSPCGQKCGCHTCKNYGSCPSSWQRGCPAPTGQPTRQPTPRPTEQLNSQISPGSGPFDTGSGSSNSGGSGGSSGGSGGADMGPIIGAVVGVVLLLAVGALWFYRRSKLSETKPSGAVDSPAKPLEPIKARPEEEATAIAIAPEAEEILAEQPAAAKGLFSKGWFSAAEPEGEAESFASEAEVAAAEIEPEFEPEPEC